MDNRVNTNRYTLFEDPRGSFKFPSKRLTPQSQTPQKSPQEPVVGAFGAVEGGDSGSATNAPSRAISGSNLPTLTQGELRLDLSSLNLPSPRLSVTPGTTPQGTNQATVRVDLERTMRQTNPALATTYNKIPTADASAPVAGGQLGVSQTVIDRILKSEGQTAVQSGMREYFGFRSNHPAFNKIQSAVRQYGVSAPQTRELVSSLIVQRARTVGADKFTDPGVQAAILSIAHMRGEGGAQAILNSVAGAPIIKSGKLSNETVNSINSMNPQEFQDKLRQVREMYDKQIYGNKTDSVVINGKTVTGNWWDLFGKGLVNRYDRERNEFSALSMPAKSISPQIASR